MKIQFLKKFLGKSIHVDYFEKDGFKRYEEGKLVDIDEENSEITLEGEITVTNIDLKKIKTVYLKETAYVSKDVVKSFRNQILLLKERINILSKKDRLISLKELYQEVKDDFDEKEFIETIEKLCVMGDLFKPKRDFVQIM